jgi:hypothetical protein
VLTEKPFAKFASTSFALSFSIRKVLLAVIRKGEVYYMVIRIGSAVLTVAGLLALISGLLFWAGTALNLMALHMLLGFLAVGALWVIGLAQAFSQGGSWVVALCALIVGAAMIVIGMMQSSLIVGEFHWVVQLIHLLLGLLTIGIGHVAAARSRKASVGKQSMSQRH